jgi:hypothetical protein
VAFSKNEAVFLRAEVTEWNSVVRDQNCLCLIAKPDRNEILESRCGMLKTPVNGDPGVDLCFQFAPNGSLARFRPQLTSMM